MSSRKDKFNYHYICQHAWERLIIPQEELEEAAGKRDVQLLGCPVLSDQDESEENECCAMLIIFQQRALSTQETTHNVCLTDEIVP